MALAELRGKVVMGFGYAGSTAHAQYEQALQQVLGQNLFPGTLNIELELPPDQIFHIVQDGFIPPPLYNGKEYIRYEYCRVRADRDEPESSQTRLPGYILRFTMGDEGTSHRQVVIKVVSEVKLREALQLQDGDRVVIELFKDLDLHMRPRKELPQRLG